MRGSYISRHENGPKQDAEHETIILEVNVVHYDEARMQK
jgi:hypothetical protein